IYGNVGYLVLVPPHFGDQATIGNAPQAQCCVITSRHRTLTVWRERNPKDFGCVPLQTMEQFAIVNIPDDGRIVVTARNEPLTVRRKGECFNRIGVTFE